MTLLADTTGIDIADTAIKIGLGALISGGLAVWLAIVNHKHELEKAQAGYRHDFDKEKLRRKQDALAKVVDEFEGARAVFFKLGEQCVRLLKRPETATEITTLLRDHVPNAQHALLSMSGRLMLMDLRECARIMDAFRESADKLVGKANPLLRDNLTDIESELARLKQLRLEFYEAASKANN